MSIVRVGLAETEKFAEGYEAIFGKKDEPKPSSPSNEQSGTPAAPHQSETAKKE